jgi:hypothetical protein
MNGLILEIGMGVISVGQHLAYWSIIPGTVGKHFIQGKPDQQGRKISI